jgi:N-acyl homoserine lactone hydrolase
MTKSRWLALFVGIVVVTTSMSALPASLRLYVFDCGQLNYNNATNYQLKADEVARTDMGMGCYLIAHPKGTLMWDVGAIPDGSWKPTGSPVRLHFMLPDKTERDVTITKPLKTQLTAAGYSPKDIKYLALSHYHWDHIANANDFAGATWIARKTEHDIMFSAPEVERTIRANYNKLGKAKTIIINNEDYDVFGDGKVVMKLTPGHTPGHQVLFLDLPKTGKIVLAGDLYHYPEERTLNRIPPRDFNPQQTAASRTALEAFLKQSGAALWIQHDVAAHAKLKKAPEYYE